MKMEEGVLETYQSGWDNCKYHACGKCSCYSISLM